MLCARSGRWCTPGKFLLCHFLTALLDAVREMHGCHEGVQRVVESDVVVLEQQKLVSCIGVAAGEAAQTDAPT